MSQRKVLVGVAALVGSITLAEAARSEPGSWSEPQFQSGQASWYGPGFHGRRTASGEIFNTQDMTAAHRTLPFGARVRVTNHRTGRSTIVRINDRGPYAHGRVIDLSRASAEAIGLSGVASVSLARL